MVLEQDILVPSPEFKKCIKILDWRKLTIPFLVEKVVGNIIDSLKCTEIITLKHACVIGAIFDIDKRKASTIGIKSIRTVEKK